MIIIIKIISVACKDQDSAVFGIEKLIIGINYDTRTPSSETREHSHGQ